MKVCIVGDFNFPTIKSKGEWSGVTDNEFIMCLRKAFLLQMVDKPTRIRLGQTGNILDLVLVNEEQLVYKIEHYSPIGKSDHETLFFNLYIGVDRWNEKDEGYTLDLKNGNYAKMRQMLKQTRLELNAGQ